MQNGMVRQNMCVWGCVYLRPCVVPCSVSPWVFTEIRAVSPHSRNLSSGRDCSDMAGPQLQYCAFPQMGLGAPSEVP